MQAAAQAAQAAASTSCATTKCPPPAFSLLRVRGLPPEHSWWGQLTAELFLHLFDDAAAARMSRAPALRHSDDLLLKLGRQAQQQWYRLQVQM